MSNSLIKLLETDLEQPFLMIAESKASNEEIKEFLLEINNRGINADLLLAAAKVFRDKMIKVKAPENAIDVCGTGGDGLKTLNISTAVAFVVAACGITVAKHGNRAVSSDSGSADIFNELGIDLNLSKEKIEESLRVNNLAFLFAPNYHPAFKNVVQARKELGVKTIFNYLGPLLNPACVKYQIIGCPDPKIAKILSEIALKLGEENCYAVCGKDGMDELSISSDSMIFKSDGSELLFNPQEYGFKKVALEEIAGKDPKYNASKLVDLLKGEKSAYFDTVLINSALALEVVLKANNFADSLQLARKAIDNGAAYEVLRKLQEFK